MPRKFINFLTCPYYLNEVFEFASSVNISLRNNFLKFKQPFRNTNTGKKVLSFIGPSFWNQIPETLKTTDNFNTFKHNLKNNFFNQMTGFVLILPLLLILLFINIIKSSNVIVIINTVVAIIIPLLLFLLVLLLSSILFSFFSSTHYNICTIFVEGPQ